MASLVAIALLALVHMSVGKLKFMESERRSAWLSASGGAALAYVFLYVLPALAAKQQLLANAKAPGMLGFLEHHVYLLSMFGVLVYYALDQAASSVRRAPRLLERPRLARLLALDIQIVGFAAYSVLVGYLITETPSGRHGRLACMVLAMMLHFIGTDYHLRRENPHVYDRVVRWIFVASVFTGWLIGMSTQISPEAMALWFAFLAGSIIILVIRDELPLQSHAMYWPFLTGALTYAALIFTLEFFKTLDYSN